MTFSGVEIVYSEHATEPTPIPPAKNRKPRVLKKLRKRAGRRPAIYQLDGKLIVHPAFRVAIKAAMFNENYGMKAKFGDFKLGDVAVSIPVNWKMPKEGFRYAGVQLMPQFHRPIVRTDTNT